MHLLNEWEYSLILTKILQDIAILKWKFQKKKKIERGRWDFYHLSKASDVIFHLASEDNGFKNFQHII